MASILPAEIRKVYLKSFQSFKQLNLPLPLSRALEQMKFTIPTPVQAASIPAALEGKDILGTAQTGTGKTGAFGIPLLVSLYFQPRHQALILAPTRELAAQIHAVLGQLGCFTNFKGALVVGGESFHRQGKDLSGNPHYIVATPGRLNDHLERRSVSLARINHLVLDEVDRMLDMGFAPQIRRIMRYVPSSRQTLLFSATVPQELLGLAGQFLKDPVRIEIGPSCQPVPQIKEETVRTTQQGKNALLLKETEKREGRILIFARTQLRTQRVARMLYEKGHGVVCLHGGRSQAQRKQALNKFRRGSHRIMVATDLAGRGIDIDDIGHVINYDVPATREDYIHRIGRSARCGKQGEALNFLIAADMDGERVISGVKAPSRVIYRTKRWPVRRTRKKER
jgi:superfamily II DNA/RNA helicase